MQGLTFMAWASLHNVSQHLREGIAWWRNELQGVFPWLESVLSQRTPTALILSEAGRTIVIVPNPTAPGASLSPCAEVVFDREVMALPEGECARIRDLCAGRQIELSLSAAEVFCTGITLPAEVTGNLRKAVSYRLLTDAPIDPSLMLFDCSVPNINRSDNTINVTVSACRHETVDQVLAHLSGRGLEVAAIGFAPPDQRHLAYVFKKSAVARATSNLEKVNRFLFAAGVLVVLFFLPALYLTALWMQRDLNSEIDAINSARDGAPELLTRASRLGQISAVLTRERRPVSLAAAINELSARVPKSAWLSEVHFDGRSLRLVGYAADPPAVSSALAGSEVLIGVKLESVSAQTPVEQSPRIEISAALPDMRR